jgi:D-serine deaminase-like pyridoxal phosphate-dependent protein
MDAADIQARVPKSDIDTPALLLDLDTVEQNVERMAGYIAARSVALRPHVKLHRATPQLVQMQLDAGAAGFTCAKLSEAESLVSAGITDILIANQIVGRRKLERLVKLAGQSQLKVAVDSPENVKELSQAAQAGGVTIGVLVEVNIGHNRCGVAPFGPTLELARLVSRSPGLTFMGLMGYDGHCTLKVTEAEREALSKKANTLLVDTARYLKNAGLRVEIVSGAGTFTYRFASEIKGLTEIQAGTYLLMDTAFQEHGVREFKCALTVLTTVISRPTYPDAGGLVIVDTGRKSISPALGLPEVKNPGKAKVLSLSDEHGRVIVDPEAEAVGVGDQIELWVRDANGTINQFDRFYAMRGETVEAIWKIPLGGSHT